MLFIRVLRHSCNNIKHSFALAVFLCGCLQPAFHFLCLQAFTLTRVTSCNARSWLVRVLRHSLYASGGRQGSLFVFHYSAPLHFNTKAKGEQQPNPKNEDKAF
jgi:hypothetical protein